MAMRDHLSFSQLNTYMSCPLKYWYQYVLGIKPSTTPASLAFGGAIHRALAWHLQSQLEGDPMPESEVLAYFEADWFESVEREHVLFSRHDGDSLLVLGKGMLLAYLESPAPQAMQLVGIEEPFTLTIDPELPPVVGTLDALYVSVSAPTAALVVDFKTSAASMPESRVAQDLQLTCYSLALSAMGYPVAEQTVGFTVLTKTKTPKVQQLMATRTAAQQGQFVKTAKQIYGAILADLFYPRRDLQCAGCPYAELCEAW